VDSDGAFQNMKNFYVLIMIMSFFAIHGPLTCRQRWSSSINLKRR